MRLVFNLEHYNIILVRNVQTHQLFTPGESSAWAYPQILSYRPQP